MTVKLVGSTSGSVSLQAPASTSGGAHRVLTLPDVNGTIATTATAGKFVSYAVIADQKSSGTVSGTFVSGGWRVRDLNTELADADGIVSISSNQFTLQAGTYLIKWSCPAYGRSYHASRLRNNTDGINYSGASVYSDYNSNVQNTSIGAARLTIGAAKVFEIQHRCDNSSSGENTAFGVRVGNAFTVDYEIYTICEIYKEV